MDFTKIWLDYNPSTYQQNKRCLSVNTILAGKYLVGPVLGQGGFGITYQGYDLNMETQIAIKEYFPVELVSRDTTTVHGDHVLSLSGEKSITYKQGLKKYVEEAQNVSQFSEVPGVVSVKDFFYENETAYIVMEYIEGESLKDYLKRKGGRLSEEETLFIMKPVIEALTKIHQAGIIHRDISPDNIMLSFDASKDNSVPEKVKSIKLIDFGAARMTAKNDQKSLTIILKHGYAPEEQYRTHGEQGAWTDVYAICATIYRMLVGETPVPAMDRMFQDSLKSLDLFGIKISKNTQNALIKGLAVKKDDRIQTMEELLAALYEGKKVSSALNNSNRKKIKSGLMASIVAVGVIAIVALSNIAMKSAEPTNHSQEMAEDNVIEESTENIAEDVVLMENVSNEPVELVMEAEEEVIGETIAYPHPQTSISGKSEHLLICLSDGTVKALGSNSYGQCNVSEWHDIVAVSTSSSHSLGLRSDGKVFAAGYDSTGQCAVDEWTDIVQIAAGSDISYGLTKQGTVVSAGIPYGDIRYAEKISQWQNIVAIATDMNAGIFVLDKNGNIFYEGEEEWPEISGWNDVTQLVYSATNLVGIKADGSMLIAKNTNLDYAPELTAWTDMKQLCLDPTLGVDLDGNVVMQHDLNDYYVDSTDIDNILEELSTWTDIKAIWSSYSSDYIVGLKEDDSIIEYRRNVGNADIGSMKDLAWVNVIGEEFMYFNDTLIAGTNDGKILINGAMVEAEMLLSAVEYSSFDATQIKCVVDGWLLQLADGRIYDYARNKYVGEQVKQVIPLGNIYLFIMENGQNKFYDLTSVYEYEETYYEGWNWIIDILDRWLAEDNHNTKVEYKNGIGLILNQEQGIVNIFSTDDQTDRLGIEMVQAWTDIQDIAIGETHVVGLKTDGTVVAVGGNHMGQCDVEDWSDIVYIEAGSNCTLGITKDGELKITGSL